MIMIVLYRVDMVSIILCSCILSSTKRERNNRDSLMLSFILIVIGLYCHQYLHYFILSSHLVSEVNARPLFMESMKKLNVSGL